MEENRDIVIVLCCLFREGVEMEFVCFVQIYEMERKFWLVFVRTILLEFVLRKTYGY